MAMSKTESFVQWQEESVMARGNGKESEFPCNGNKGALWQVAMAKRQRGVKATSVLAVLGFLKSSVARLAKPKLCTSM